MPVNPLYTDRLGMTPPRTQNALSDATARALLSFVEQTVEKNWLAAEFPIHCTDGGYVIGTNDSALGTQICAMIPGIEWPLWKNAGDLSDDVLFDLLEYVGQSVSLPVEGSFHDFFRHHRLSFKKPEGRRQYRDRVNAFLARAGAAYEMGFDLTISRVGPPEVHEVLSALKPASGDSRLDALIERARALYLSRKASDRLLALQTMWDAFERLKTIDIPGKDKKRQSSQALLDNVSSPALRAVIADDMKALTDSGNKFGIRHHETDQEQLPEELYDYFIVRMANVVLTLLDQSGRLATD